MVVKLANRVKETTSTTGTGTIDLAGAVTGFRAFSDELSNGDDVYYLIVDDPDDPTDYEFGEGTYTAGTPDTLSRDTVLGSSNSDNKVSFSSGTKTVIVADVKEVYTGWQLISEQTASASSSIDFTSGIDDTFDEYQLSIIEAIPASDGASLQLLTDSNGGASFDNGGGDYIIHVVEQDDSAAGFTSATNGSAVVITIGLGIGNVTDEGVASARIDFFNPSGTTLKPFFQGWACYTDSSGNKIVSRFLAVRDAVAAINALRVQFSVGNISSGTFRLYGRRY